MSFVDVQYLNENLQQTLVIISLTLSLMSLLPHASLSLSSSSSSLVSDPSADDVPMETDNHILQVVRDQLLLGLGDESDEIK